MDTMDDFDLDDDFGSEFDDDLDFDFGDDMADMPPPADTREAVMRTFSSGGNYFMREFTDDPISAATDFTKKSLPKTFMSPVSDMGDVTSSFMDSFSDAKDEVAKSTSALLDTVEDNYGDVEAIGSLTSKLRSWFNLRHDDDDYDRGIEEMDLAVSNVISTLGESKDTAALRASMVAASTTHKQGATTNGLLSKIATESAVISNFNMDITNAYYRKSLELQYRQVFTAENQLALVKAGFEGFKNQFESIIRNTGLPDIVKTKGTELLKATLTHKVTESFFDNKNVKAHVADKLLGYITTAKDALVGGASMANDMVGMDTGMSGGQLLGMTGADLAKGYIGGRIGKMIEKTETGKKANNFMQELNMDTSSKFSSMADETNNEYLSKTFNFLSNFTDVSDKKSGISATAIDKDSRVNFDGATKIAITKVIPGYLSKILAEVTGIRTGMKTEELRYDVDRGTFDSVSQLKGNLDSDISSMLGDNKIFSATDAISAELATKGGLELNDDEEAELQKRLVTHSLSGKSILPSALEKNGFYDGLSEELSSKLKVAMDRYVNTGDVATTGENRETLNKWLSYIKQNTKNPTDIIDKLQSSNSMDLLTEKGILTYNPTSRTYDLNEDKYREIISDVVAKKSYEIDRSKRLNSKELEAAIEKKAELDAADEDGVKTLGINDRAKKAGSKILGFLNDKVGVTKSDEDVDILKASNKALERSNIEPVNDTVSKESVIEKTTNYINELKSKISEEKESFERNILKETTPDIQESIAPSIVDVVKDETTRIVGGIRRKVAEEQDNISSVISDKLKPSETPEIPKNFEEPKQDSSDPTVVDGDQNLINSNEPKIDEPKSVIGETSPNKEEVEESLLTGSIDNSTKAMQDQTSELSNTNRSMNDLVDTLKSKMEREDKEARKERDLKGVGKSSFLGRYAKRKLERAKDVASGFGTVASKVGGAAGATGMEAIRKGIDLYKKTYNIGKRAVKWDLNNGKIVRDLLKSGVVDTSISTGKAVGALGKGIYKIPKNLIKNTYRLNGRGLVSDLYNDVRDTVVDTTTNTYDAFLNPSRGLVKTAGRASYLVGSGLYNTGSSLLGKIPGAGKLGSRLGLRKSFKSYAERFNLDKKDNAVESIKPTNITPPADLGVKEDYTRQLSSNVVDPKKQDTIVPDKLKDDIKHIKPTNHRLADNIVLKENITVDKPTEATIDSKTAPVREQGSIIPDKLKEDINHIKSTVHKLVDATKDKLGVDVKENITADKPTETVTKLGTDVIQKTVPVTDIGDSVVDKIYSLYDKLKSGFNILESVAEDNEEVEDDEESGIPNTGVITDKVEQPTRVMSGIKSHIDKGLTTYKDKATTLKTNIAEKLTDYKESVKDKTAKKLTEYRESALAERLDRYKELAKDTVTTNLPVLATMFNSVEDDSVSANVTEQLISTISDSVDSTTALTSSIVSNVVPTLTNEAGVADLHNFEPDLKNSSDNIAVNKNDTSEIMNPVTKANRDVVNIDKQNEAQNENDVSDRIISNPTKFTGINSITERITRLGNIIGVKLLSNDDSDDETASNNPITKIIVQNYKDLKDLLSELGVGIISAFTGLDKGDVEISGRKGGWLSKLTTNTYQDKTLDYLRESTEHEIASAQRLEELKLALVGKDDSWLERNKWKILATTVAGVGATIASYWGDIKEYLGGIWDSTKDLGRTIVGGVVDAGKYIGGFFGGINDALFGIPGEIIGGIGTVFKNTITWLWDKIKGVFGSIGDVFGIGDGIRSGFDFVSDAATATGDFFKSGYNWLWGGDEDEMSEAEKFVANTTEVQKKRAKDIKAMGITAKDFNGLPEDEVDDIISGAVEYDKAKLDEIVAKKKSEEVEKETPWYSSTASNVGGFFSNMFANTPDEAKEEMSRDVDTVTKSDIAEADKTIESSNIAEHLPKDKDVVSENSFSTFLKNIIPNGVTDKIAESYMTAKGYVTSIGGSDVINDSTEANATDVAKAVNSAGEKGKGVISAVVKPTDNKVATEEKPEEKEEDETPWYSNTVSNVGGFFSNMFANTPDEAKKETINEAKDGVTVTDMGESVISSVTNKPTDNVVVTPEVADTVIQPEVTSPWTNLTSPISSYITPTMTMVNDVSTGLFNRVKHMSYDNGGMSFNNEQHTVTPVNEVATIDVAPSMPSTVVNNTTALPNAQGRIIPPNPLEATEEENEDSFFSKEVVPAAITGAGIYKLMKNPELAASIGNGIVGAGSRIIGAGTAVTKELAKAIPDVAGTALTTTGKVAANAAILNPYGVVKHGVGGVAKMGYQVTKAGYNAVKEGGKALFGANKTPPVEPGLSSKEFFTRQDAGGRAVLNKKLAERNINNTAKVLPNEFTDFKTDMKDKFKGAKNEVGVLGKVKDDVSDFVDNKTVNPVTDKLDTPKVKNNSWWGSIKDSVSKSVDSAKSWVSDKATKAWDLTKGGITSTWDTIKEHAGNTWDSIKAGKGGAWERIKNAAGPIWEKVKGKVLEVGNGLLTGISGGIDSAKEKIGTMLKGVGIPSIDSMLESAKAMKSKTTAIISSLSGNPIVKKLVDSAFAKSAAKKLPLAGIPIAGYAMYERMQEGDEVGATLEGVSGIAGQIPGPGWVIAAGADATLLHRGITGVAEELKDIKDGSGDDIVPDTITDTNPTTPSEVGDKNKTVMGSIKETLSNIDVPDVTFAEPYTTKLIEGGTNIVNTIKENSKAIYGKYIQSNNDIESNGSGIDEVTPENITSSSHLKVLEATVDMYNDVATNSLNGVLTTTSLMKEKLAITAESLVKDISEATSEVTDNVTNATGSLWGSLTIATATATAAIIKKSNEVLEVGNDVAGDITSRALDTVRGDETVNSIISTGKDTVSKGGEVVSDIISTGREAISKGSQLVKDTLSTTTDNLSRMVTGSNYNRVLRQMASVGWFYHNDDGEIVYDHKGDGKIGDDEIEGMKSLNLLAEKEGIDPVNNNGMEIQLRAKDRLAYLLGYRTKLNPNDKNKESVETESSLIPAELPASATSIIPALVKQGSLASTIVDGGSSVIDALDGDDLKDIAIYASGVVKDAYGAINGDKPSIDLTKKPPSVDTPSIDKPINPPADKPTIDLSKKPPTVDTPSIDKPSASDIDLSKDKPSIDLTKNTPSMDKPSIDLTKADTPTIDKPINPPVDTPSKSWWGSITDTISESVDSAKDWAGEKVNKVGTSIVEAKDWVVDKATKAWDLTKSGVSSTWDSIKEHAGNTWDSIKAGTGNAWDKVKAVAGPTWEKLKGGALELGGKLVNGLSGGIDAAKEKITTTLGKIGIPSIDSMIESAKEMKNKTPQLMASLANNATAQRILKSSLAKSVIKKLPLVGVAMAGYGAYDRLSEGDETGAALEVVSGIGGQIPGPGWVISAAADGTLLYRDLSGISDEAKDVDPDESTPTMDPEELAKYEKELAKLEENDIKSKSDSDIDKLLTDASGVDAPATVDEEVVKEEEKGGIFSSIGSSISSFASRFNPFASTPESEPEPKKIPDSTMTPDSTTNGGSATAKPAPMATGPIRDGDGGSRFLTFGNNVDISGLNPSMNKNLLGMATEYNELTGKTIGLNSAYRSYEYQAELRKRLGSKAAKPGYSTHEFGLAVDMNQSTANELESLGLMRKYGFTRPVGGEPWHVEPAGIQVDLATAKKNPSAASALIDYSLGRGGGGWGTVNGVKKYSRNAKFQEDLMLETGGEIVEASEASNTAPSTDTISKIATPTPIIEVAKEEKSSSLALPVANTIIDKPNSVTPMKPSADIATDTEGKPKATGASNGDSTNDVLAGKTLSELKNSSTIGSSQLSVQEAILATLTELVKYSKEIATRDMVLNVVDLDNSPLPESKKPTPNVRVNRDPEAMPVGGISTENRRY